MDAESSLSNYKALLDKFDPKSTSPTDRARLGSAFTDSFMKLKDAHKLGALTGGDAGYLLDQLGDPTTVRGAVKAAAFGKDPFNGQVGEVEKMLARERQNWETVNKTKMPTAARPPATKAPTQAPANAVEMLRQNPSLAPAFQAKYGYLPGGN